MPLQILLAALLCASLPAFAQVLGPADQEKLRAAGLPMRPGALHNAAAFGNVELVRKFLAAGISANVRDGQGRTPLLLAVETSMLAKLPEPRRRETIDNKIAVARLLLERGADVRVKSNAGFHLLHTAAHLGDFADLAEEFIARGADAAALDAQWLRTPLFVAAMYDDIRMIDVLLRHRADPNFRDLRKWTPLMMSALLKRPAAAARLIEAGADPDLPNQDGVTPMQIAMNSGNPELIAIFRTRR